jgi:hypothetical protein
VIHPGCRTGEGIANGTSSSGKPRWARSHNSRRSVTGRQPQPGHHRRSGRFRGHRQDRLVRPVPRANVSSRVVGLVEHELHDHWSAAGPVRQVSHELGSGNTATLSRHSDPQVVRCGQPTPVRDVPRVADTEDRGPPTGCRTGAHHQRRTIHRSQSREALTTDPTTAICRWWRVQPHFRGFRYR